MHCIFIFLFMFLNIFFCFFQMASSSTTTARARRPTRWPPASNCRWPNTPAKTKNHFYRFKRNFGWKKVTLYWSKDLTIALKITAVLFFPRAKFFKKSSRHFVIQNFLLHAWNEEQKLMIFLLYLFDLVRVGFYDLIISCG